MTLIKELLDRNIEENIAPVVYFHEQKIEFIAKEVADYVITTRPGTGGESGGGIHEQFVSILTQIADALEQKNTSLPASWISGFFGSGKSSFAKLLGLALDDIKLPNNESLAEALIKRDDTPEANKLQEAWDRLMGLIEPISTIFDIGSASRGDEGMYKTVYRHVRLRLGYSSTPSIAYHEQLIEEDGLYDKFLQLCEEHFKKPWSKIKESRKSERAFSKIYSELYPDEYPEMTSWLDRHQASEYGQDANSPEEAVKGIEEMLNRRAPGKTLFIVIDEMSQFINDNKQKMLDVQSFVSALGSRLKGRVWFLVTGQERLIDINENLVIGKMQDRFPPFLRVHLDRSNVQEIVYRRLLKKNPETVTDLKTLFDKPGIHSNLKLEAYECGELSEQDFIDHYPLLPGHIPLLLDISQGIRNNSTRIQADASSVRGVLQIIWDLFNGKNVNFKNREIGALVTLDGVYDIQRSALSSDTLLTMDKIETASKGNSVKLKTAKAIAMLETIQEQQPTTDKLIASVLYSGLGESSILEEVQTAIKELERENLIIEQEKLGWRIQDHAGQDWNRQRDEINISVDAVKEMVNTQLKEIMGTVERPKLHGTPLNWDLYKSASEKLSGIAEYPAACLDLRYITTQKERMDMDFWVEHSKEISQQERFIWVCGDHNELNNVIRAYLKSEKMISTNENRKLDRMKERLLSEEKARKERLFQDLPRSVRACWMNGQIFFKGTAYNVKDKGNTIDTVLKAIVEPNLGDIYSSFQNGNFSLTKDKDITELFKSELTSPNPKFMDNEGLGLLKMDAGKIVFSADGIIPKQIKEYLETNPCIASTSLIKHFGKPAYGYPKPVIKACLIALLRTESIAIEATNGKKFTSYKDPGARDLIMNENSFKQSDIVNQKDRGIGPRDKIKCAKFFKDSLTQDVNRENDALTDAVFSFFPPIQIRINSIKTILNRMLLETPERISSLFNTVNSCLKDRNAEATIQSLITNLDSLKDGISFLKDLETNLTDSTEKAINTLRNVLETEARQLKDVQLEADASNSVDLIKKHLKGETPWRAYADVLPECEKIKKSYGEKRAYLIDQVSTKYETVINQLKIRKDYRNLTTDQVKEVTQVIDRERSYSSVGDLEPALIFLNSEIKKLEIAELKAHEFIDSILEEEPPDGPGGGGTGGKITEKVSLNFLKNRTLVTELDLDGVLDELREQCMTHLNQDKKVRLI